MVTSKKIKRAFALISFVLFFSTLFVADNTYAYGTYPGLQAIAHCWDNYEIKGYDSGGVYNLEYFTLYGEDSVETIQLPVCRYNNGFSTNLYAEDYSTVTIDIEGSLPSNVYFNGDSRQLKDVWLYADTSETATVSTGRIVYRTKTNNEWSGYTIANVHNITSLNTFEDCDMVHITILYELRRQNWIGSNYYNIRADYLFYIA
jgi:hypothetical protein